VVCDGLVVDWFFVDCYEFYFVFVDCFVVGWVVVEFFLRFFEVVVG